jgi:hypothetical protein
MQTRTRLLFLAPLDLPAVVTGGVLGWDEIGCAGR